MAIAWTRCFDNPISASSARPTRRRPHGRDGGEQERLEGDPPSSVTIACPPERRAQLKSFYQNLLDQDLPCGEADDSYRPPRWPDPQHPQQMHLDVFVTDLDTGEEIVLAHGGSTLQRHDDYRIFADPFGHPLCLYPDTSGRAFRAPGMIARIVIDCPRRAELATFMARCCG